MSVNQLIQLVHLKPAAEVVGDDSAGAGRHAERWCRRAPAAAK